ncbi:hypothetical protein VTJ49DRAFT_1915 [Mycothermus thermophilus]|uniref:SigF-like NTF2-like domain-containing protein n=1 Tax=Humicola insolens TaxID=85995 RepID=A0ABR3VCD9_HUMIN
MENPAREIESVIRALTQGSPSEQRNAIYHYYAPGAAFEHPFCRVPSFKGVYVPGIGDVDSRAFITAIYRWYKIMSPKIHLSIESCAHDPKTQTLYLSLSQTFSIRFLPFHRAPVHLTSVLHLTEAPPPPPPTTATGASSPDVNAIINPTPPPPYDAAQDKLHAVQEGAEPSYAAVTAGDAPASPTTSSRRRSSSGAGAGAGAGAGTRAAGGGEEEDKKKKKWVIKAQSDFYNTPDQARLVAGVSPASVVTSLMQLTATVWCAAAAGVVGWVFGMLRPITVSVMLWFEYLRFVVRRLWYYALGGIHSEGYGSGVGRMKGGGDEKKGRGRI